MAQLARKLLKLFGEDGGTGEFGQFGSDAAGSPITTKDIDNIQSLQAWFDGWFTATTNATEPPRIEDMNGIFYVLAYMQKYNLQAGIAEWLITEDYYNLSSICQYNGAIYLAIADNTGDQPDSVPASWRLMVPAGGALGINNNLSDLASAATARTNLDVYSKSESEALFPVEVLTIDSDRTMLIADNYKKYNCNPNTATQYGLLTITMMAGETSNNIEYPFIHGPNEGLVKIVPNGTQKFNVKGRLLDYIFLYAPGDKVSIFWNGSEWTASGKLRYYSGMISNQGWQNRRFGFSNVAYDGQSDSSDLTGLTFTEATSNNTGVVLADSNPTGNSGILYVYHATGTGVWINDRVLTFSNSKTALVNETVGGSNKNINTNSFVKHDMNLIPTEVNYFVSDSGDYGDAFQIYPFATNASNDLGKRIIDYNSLEYNSGGGGFLYLDENFLVVNVNTQDWFFAIEVIFDF
jgi:hypothetical protein